MTSFAFILGVMPLYFATGAGALGRHSVGTAVVGGMLVSTILNLFFIPVLYVFAEPVAAARRRAQGGTSGSCCLRSYGLARCAMTYSLMRSYTWFVTMPRSIKSFLVR